MEFPMLNILYSSSTLWIIIYGFWFVGAEFVYNVIPVALCGITLLTTLTLLMRIPAPSKEDVEAVIGKDPGLVREQDNCAYVMRSGGHRGAFFDAPENSLIAFKMCAEKGCNAVEFDLALSKDNVPIIFHDDTLERLTDSMRVVRKMTWNELKEVDISIKHPLKERFKNTSICTFEEAIQQCLADKQRMFIDIKECDAKIVKVILDMYKKYPSLSTYGICSSFYPQVIYKIRSANPKIVCGLAWRPFLFCNESYSAANGVGDPRSRNVFGYMLNKICDILMNWALPRVIYYLLGISLVLLHKDIISGEVICNWRAKGVRVVAWTVNHPVEKQHFSRVIKCTYLTDTLTGEISAHATSKRHINTN